MTYDELILERIKLHFELNKNKDNNELIEKLKIIDSLLLLYKDKNNWILDIINKLETQIKEYSISVYSNEIINELKWYKKYINPLDN